MVKHIKAGYKGKDGKLTDKEKSIAYATAWKASKAGKLKENGASDEDQQLSELDKSTLKSYTKAAAQDLVDKTAKLGKTDSSKKQAELTRKIVNRQHGIQQAVDQMEESKPSAGLSKKEKSEVVKKAKAGKDIGKKGKGFKDVAAKAAKQYGSKEKGEKVAAAAMWKNIKEDEELSDDVDVSEMNLKPWKKKSPFSKAGYKEVETRQKQRMKDADAAHTAADDADDEPKMKQASSDWAKAKSRAKKASIKASLAKTESTDDRDFSAKNVGLAVGNVVQGVKNTAKVIKESAELDALKKLSGL